MALFAIFYNIQHGWFVVDPVDHRESDELRQLMGEGVSHSESLNGGQPSEPARDGPGRAGHFLSSCAMIQRCRFRVASSG
jgi:hypothetical protein